MRRLVNLIFTLAGAVPQLPTAGRVPTGFYTQQEPQRRSPRTVCIPGSRLRPLWGGAMRCLFPEKFRRHPQLFCVAFHIRRLPHWEPSDAEFFVTWRLFGSLPKAAHGAVPQARSSAGAEFVALDRQLDFASGGPLWLKNAHVAELCQSSSVGRRV